MLFSIQYCFRLFIASFLSVCLSFSGCASTSRNGYTEQQKQQMETDWQQQGIFLKSNQT
jgi:uncharacterized protein YcfL